MRNTIKNVWRFLFSSKYRQDVAFSHFVWDLTRSYGECVCCGTRRGGHIWNGTHSCDSCLRENVFNEVARAMQAP